VFLSARSTTNLDILVVFACQQVRFITTSYKEVNQLTKSLSAKATDSRVPSTKLFKRAFVDHMPEVLLVHSHVAAFCGGMLCHRCFGFDNTLVALEKSAREVKASLLLTELGIQFLYQINGILHIRSFVCTVLSCEHVPNEVMIAVIQQRLSSHLETKFIELGLIITSIMLQCTVRYVHSHIIVPKAGLVLLIFK
jgi:hypothetical protein